MLKVDVFAHVAPNIFMDALLQKMHLRECPPTLTDLDMRFRFMDRFPGLLQVLSPGR